MRIIVIHPKMSALGGAERVAIQSLQTAVNAGHDVAFFSEEFDIGKVEEFFDCYGLFKNVQRITFPSFKSFAGSSFTLYQRIGYYQLQSWKLIDKKDNFDLVLGTQDVAYAPFGQATMIQYCYFPEYFLHLNSSSSSPLWNIYYGPARIFYRNRAEQIGRFLSTSNYTRRFVKSIWGRDSEVLYPPCPIDLYDDQGSPKEDLVVTVARIVPGKRINLFIDIARRLPKLEFSVIGTVATQNRAYYDLVRSNAPPNVSFLLSPLRKVRNVLSRAKVYVQCTENEHFGISVVESMASGCVPVVHDSGGPREIVTDDVGYRWHDTSEATQYIAEVVGNDSLRERLSAAARSRARMFSTEVFDSKLSSILAQYQKP